jgi:hypothetical protein
MWEPKFIVVSAVYMRSATASAVVLRAAIVIPTFLGAVLLNALNAVKY